ncbi:LacI family DNA-binding transcriptional regulator [Microbacterium ulmi]|uniref:LacI family DNA-binding transcriptional regulator n=1 Tax=Microbacterium ulmi TaxID=179095 RepID=A0A7Y2Q005_9MICO|nr:LacI family DNA-binding transcriptional regulator [Microbacterium ulmi]NII69928.1 LacI family transcriptional regulator [Microbacterium ulmi]NNH03848.1 LacI family DNA-binding transcriptional regulator [Microbacterium ulmi]
MSDDPRRRPTLAQIARLAHTSVPTVSKVLNGRSDVSGSTRVRVMSVAAGLGYRAPGIRKHTGEPLTGLIDLVLSGVEGTWANRALSGVERAAFEAGLDVVITLAGSDGDEWLARLLARGSQGAVLALVPATPDQLAILEAARIPVVLLDPVMQPPAHVASVGATNWAGGRAAAQHLVELGHTRFAVVGGRHEHLYSQARIDGFRSTVRAAGFDLPDDFVVHAQWQREEAARVAGPLFAAADRPTAVFACSDGMALGVLDAARAAGLDVPRDLSVIGFDDLPEASWAQPQLTTVRQSVTQMGAAALRMLLRLRATDHATAPREELATELIVRSSTGGPPA